MVELIFQHKLVICLVKAIHRQNNYIILVNCAATGNGHMTDPKGSTSLKRAYSMEAVNMSEPPTSVEIGYAGYKSA